MARLNRRAQRERRQIILTRIFPIAAKPPFRKAQGPERSRRATEGDKAKMNHGGTEPTEIRPLAETITAVATKEHKELKENFPVIYVLICGETAFGLILMQRAPRGASLRSILSCP